MTSRSVRFGVMPATILAVATAIAAFGIVLDRLPGRAAPDLAADQERPAVGSDAPDAEFDRLFREGIAHLSRGQAHAAAKAFEYARRRRPHVAEAYVNLGFSYLALAQTAAARAAFETAIELRPGQANAYFGLAESHEQLQEPEAALKAMRTYVELTPADDPHRRRALAAIWEWEFALESTPGRSNRADRATVETVGRTAQLASPGKAAIAALGSSAPYLSLLGPGRGADSLASFSGKSVVLNVWATWCAPCRAELPSLQRLSEQLDPQRFAVIGLSVDKDPDFVREFLREVGVNYANYIDSSQHISSGVLGVDSFPQTFVIAPDGTIVEHIVGVRVWDDPQVVAALRTRR